MLFELDTPEREYLLSLLEEARSGLSTEIHHAMRTEFKDELHARASMNEELQRRLRAETGATD